MLHILRICVVFIMYRNCLAIMTCPPNEYVLSGTDSCWCNGTNAYWEKDGESVVNEILHSNTSSELQLIYNSSEPNVTYTCCVTRDQSHDCNDTYAPKFAFGPTDIHLVSPHVDTPFYLCPDSQDATTVTCDAFGVRPEPATMNINLVATNSCLTFNGSACLFRPRNGGIVNVTCTASNTKYPNVTVTTTFSLSVYEPPVLKINNMDPANNTIPIISLLRDGNQTISCSSYGGYPLLSYVNVSCEGVFEPRLVGNGTEVSIPNFVCSTLCYCRSDQWTRCNQSATIARLVMAENLYFVDNQTSSNFKLKSNSTFSQTLHLGGCPLPYQFKLTAKGVPANQMKANFTCEVHVGSENFPCDLLSSGTLSVAEATVRLTVGPLDEDYFTTYMLVIRNIIGQELVYHFVLSKDSEDNNNLNLPLIVGLSASVGGVLLLTIAIVSTAVIICKRRRKSQPSETSVEVQATPKTKVYRLATTDHNDQAAVYRSTADSESGQSVPSTPTSVPRQTHPTEVMDNNRREITSDEDTSSQPLKTMYDPPRFPPETMSAPPNVSANITDALRHLTVETWGASQLLDSETAVGVSSPVIPSVVVTEATPQLPAKVGKRKNLQASKSIYDIPPSQDCWPISNGNSENSQDEFTLVGFEPSYSEAQSQPVDEQEPPLYSEPPVHHGAPSKTIVTITSDVGDGSSSKKSGYENVVLRW